MKVEIKRGPFFASVGSIRKNKKSLFYAVLADVAFLFKLYILAALFNRLSFGLSNQVPKLMFLAIIYFLTLVLAYSFFKYVILSLVKAAYEKSKLNFSRFWNFFLLNLFLIIMLSLVFLIMSLLAASVKAGLAPIISLIILVLFILGSYSLANISHVLFYRGNSLSNSLGSGLMSLVKIRSYYGVYLVFAAALGFVLLLFSIFGTTLKNTYFQDYNVLLQYGDAYTILFVHAVGAIFYLAMMFNRFYFYSLVKKVSK